MDFVAIDVETANADMATVCQVGVASYASGALVNEWVSLVDPEDYFEPLHVWIHGIDEEAVKGAPQLPEGAEGIRSLLEGQVAVCHTHFDRVAVRQAFSRYHLGDPECLWLDSARVARRAWSEFAYRGYGLANVCEYLGYEFKHHDALEDAKAAGHILQEAMRQTGLSVDGWRDRVEKAIDPSSLSKGKAIERTGNPEGPLHGEVVTFTGALDITRREAADLADSIGCRVATGVTRETTMLVVGDQDVRRLVGHKKSSKHRKAEALISKGYPIRILRASDFMEIVAVSREGLMS